MNALFFFVVFVAFTSLASSSFRSCSKPPIPKPGGAITLSPSTRKSSKYRHGTVAKYSCTTKYRLQGVKSKRCKNGKWFPGGKGPRCVLVGCGKYPSIYGCNNCGAAETTRQGPPFPFGSVVNYTCALFHKRKGPASLTCERTGHWSPQNKKPQCIPVGCWPYPSPPTNGGYVSVPSEGNWTTNIGLRVNFTCPEGYGLNGIPYRICQEDLSWKPKAQRHECVAHLGTCPDPGSLINGHIHVQSFADQSPAIARCYTGFKLSGSFLRTCQASDAKNAYWDGTAPVCKDQFKKPNELAAQIRETFIDRTLKCDSTINQIPDQTQRNETNSGKSAFCHGRTVVVGNGCVDLVYAVDCSGSITEKGFELSKEFVAKSVRLFQIENGQERVGLLTYDHRIHVEFELGDLNTTAETLRQIRKAPFCGGATSTTRVLQHLNKSVISNTRQGCKKAIFILSDGRNNWGGNPAQIAKELKKIEDLEIFTVAFGDNDLGWKALREISSGEEHFIAVRNAEDVAKAVDKAIEVPLGGDYGGTCGRSVSKQNPCRDALSDHCRSTPGAWPWVVGLYVIAENNSRPDIVCVGALIGDCWILTAAHCVTGQNVLFILVVVGNTDCYLNEGTETTYRIWGIYVHPLYNPFTLEYDVALIKLCCNASYSAFVKKVCLPDCQKESYLYRKGRQCTVAGWGATKLGDSEGGGLRLSTHLRHFQLPIADRQKCQNSSKFAIKESFLCAGDGSGNQGACKGDSGGPLFTEREEETGYVVIGVVSWGEGCKQAHKYDIFTNICSAGISDWLTTQMANYPCRQCRDDTSDCSCPNPVVDIV